MQTNLWNVKSLKERIGIREKTEAQKRHLMSVVQARSNLDTRNKQWKLKSLNAGLNKRIKQGIRRDNKELVDRLSKIDKCSVSRLNSSCSKEGRKFVSITENIRSMASINRYNRIRQIENENAKFFNRLIQTSATISRQEWAKSVKQNRKYKTNMSRTKYTQPDYSQEVSRKIRTHKLTFKHLKLSRFDENVSSARHEKIR